MSSEGLPEPSTPAVGDSASGLGATVDDAAPRPGRAELRRQRELEESGPLAPAPAQTSVAAPAAMSRSDQRRAAEQQRRGALQHRALWKAWWFYPIAILIVVSVVLGVRSALTPVPDGPQWVITSSTPTPSSDAGSPSG